MNWLGQEADEPADAVPPSCYAAAVALVMAPGMPGDPMLAAFVGLSRVLLELASDQFEGDVTSRELLRLVATNLSTGVEDPSSLVPRGATRVSEANRGS